MARRKLGKLMVERLKARSGIPADKFSAVLAEAEAEYDLFDILINEGIAFLINLLKRIFESLKDN